MKLVTKTGNLERRIGIKNAIKLIANAGFDGFDYSIYEDDYVGFIDRSTDKQLIEKGREVYGYSKEFNIPCLQSHAPAFVIPQEKTAAEYVEYVKKSIMIVSETGCDRIVVHPANWFTPQDNCDLIYSKIMPFAEKMGMTILTENMYNWKDEASIGKETIPTACGTGDKFNELVGLVNHPLFGACVDIGHASMVNCEGAAKMLKTVGKNTFALHVHDTDLYDDLHTIPFVGKQDWAEITKTLREIGYKGHFTYEADSFIANFPEELLPSCLMFMERIGRYLIRQIEQS